MKRILITSAVKPASAVPGVINLNNMFKIFGFSILDREESSAFEYLSNEEPKLRKTLEKARKELISCNEKISSLESQISSLNVTIRRKDKEIIDSGDTLSDIQDRFSKASENNKKILASLKEKSMELAKTSSAYDSLKEAYDSLRESNMNLINENETLKSEKSFLEGQVALLQKYGNNEEVDEPEVTEDGNEENHEIFPDFPDEVSAPSENEENVNQEDLPGESEPQETVEEYGLRMDDTVKDEEKNETNESSESTLNPDSAPSEDDSHAAKAQVSFKTKKRKKKSYR